MTSVFIGVLCRFLLRSSAFLDKPSDKVDKPLALQEPTRSISEARTAKALSVARTALALNEVNEAHLQHSLS